MNILRKSGYFDHFVAKQRISKLRVVASFSAKFAGAMSLVWGDVPESKTSEQSRWLPYRCERLRKHKLHNPSEPQTQLRHTPDALPKPKHKRCEQACTVEECSNTFSVSFWGVHLKPVTLKPVSRIFRIFCVFVSAFSAFSAFLLRGVSSDPCFFL